MTETGLHLSQVEPTIFLTPKEGALTQLVRLHVTNSGDAAHGKLVSRVGNRARETALGLLPTGESVHELYVDEAPGLIEADFELKCGESVVDRCSVQWHCPRHWVVHVVQTSHHDVGYTDLASNVLRVHDQWLNDAIDMAESTQDWPVDARFRIVIEQSWSLVHFLRQATPERAARMLSLLRAGQFELNALFGNMTTELCSPEEMLRCLYPSFRLKREYGVPLVSAEHNDITGISWGVCQALVGAGIRFFAPGLPLYYSWGGLGLASFWDEEAIFGRRGPGAFWWQAPSGHKLLFWCNNTGCGGDPHPSLPGLSEALQRAETNGYPYDVLRWPVNGGARDNSPYVLGFAETIRDWNARWAYPHLVSSTNAAFLASFDACLNAPAAEPLPTWRGELPGQDYPVGATSTAAATAVNRNTHAALAGAEALATVASLTTDYAYQAAQLDETYEEVLMHDEHSWGHHFPAGPSALAGQLEKAVHAYRGAALAHDVLNKAMARIADHVRVDGAGIPLVVFNLTDRSRSEIVRAPLRELDNCGSTMMAVPPEQDQMGTGYLRGMLLQDRWHLNLPPEVFSGNFKLIDALTGEEVTTQLIQVQPDAAVPYAAERAGLGAGTKRYGVFEAPEGVRVDLCFTARDVPAYGYRAYRIVPGAPAKPARAKQRSRANSLENEFYCVTVSRQTGALSILDKESGRELVDGDGAHGFGALVVRDPQGGEWTTGKMRVRKGEAGPVCLTLERFGTVRGHPLIHQTLALYEGQKRIEVGMRLLKDATPLLDAHVAFPFKFAHPRFRYEGVLAVLTPGVDDLPGSQLDRLAAQNWVKVTDGEFSVLWSALDAPVVSLGQLWPGYVSPAHRCLVTEDVRLHQRVTSEQMAAHGWIYSDITYNNLGTNFAVAQNGELLFRYVITTHTGDVPDGDAAAFGRQAVSPLAQILARPLPGATLAPGGSFIMLESAEVPVTLLTLKRAEDQRGLIARIWNIGETPTVARLRVACAPLTGALRTNVVEEDGDPLVLEDAHTAQVPVGAHDLTTLRLLIQ
jgi:hypothetical protein